MLVRASGYHTRIVRLLLPLVLVVSLFAATARGAEASSRVEFGIQDDAWLEFGPGKLSDRVAAIDRLGLDAVRVTLHWDQVEVEPGEYRWSRPDRLLQALAAGGPAPVAPPGGPPGWAKGDEGPTAAPTDGADFSEFARQAALRYRFVQKWVIWNEPNKPIWLKPASPETYVQRLLNPAYAGLKSVSRKNLVGGGVTAPRAGQGGVSPVDFILRMRRAGARLDAYAHHPYPVYAGDTPYSTDCSCKTITMASLNRLVSLVGRTFPSARIWLTEYGYQTDPPDPFGVSYRDQARFIGEAARPVYLP